MRTKYLFKLTLLLAGYVIFAYIAWILRVKLQHQPYGNQVYNNSVDAWSAEKNGIHGNVENSQTGDRVLIKTEKRRGDLMSNKLTSEDFSLKYQQKKWPVENIKPSHRDFDNISSLLNKSGASISGKSNPNESKPKLRSERVKHAPSNPKTGSLPPDKQPNPKVICVRFLAGTGNRIFQFVTAYVIARKKNMTLAVPGHLKRFSEAFVFPADISNQTSRCENISSISYWGIGIYNETFIRQIDNKRSVYINGYFQSYKFFHHEIDLVRKILKFRPNVFNKAKSMLDMLFSQKYGKTYKQFQNSTAGSRNVSLVGLHVRRGDKIADKRQVVAGYKVASLEYILNAVALMKRKYPNSIFVTVSDDIRWCLEHLHMLENTLFLKTTSWPESLAILSQMDHTIMTVGTFGWWGAWLAGGDVIYYKDFLTPGSKMASLHKMSDFFPSSWIGLTDKDIISKKS